jgi:hypothetical protein
VPTDRKGVQSLLTLGGGVVLAISVFLPWYAITLTANGVSVAQQGLDNVAQQFGNSAFQSTAASVGSRFSSLVGKQLGTVSAHQVLKYISVVLLILAGVAILLTIVRLTGTGSHSQPRGTLALIGFVAALCIAFRMFARPDADADAFALSLSWGAWLALASSIAIIVGDLLPGGATQVYPQPGPTPPSSPTGFTYPARPSGPGGLSTPPRPPGWA